MSDKQLTKPFGDGEITLNFAGKVLKNVSGTVNLKESEKDFHIIQGKAMISAAGYHKLNRIAGINIISPPTLWWDGQEVSNPYPVPGKEPGVIKAFFARRLGIGFSPIGNLVITDKTLYFNIATYHQEVLVKLANEKPGTCKLGIRYLCPFAPNAKPQKGDDGEHYVIDEGKTYLFHSIEEGAGVWMDLTSPDIMKVFKDHTQRQKFAERIAQTIIDRNILKAHPSIGVQNINPKNGIAPVTAYGWKHELIRQDFDEITRKALAGEMEVDKSVETIDEADSPEITTVIESEDVPANGNGKGAGQQEFSLDQEAEDTAKLSHLLQFAKENGISTELTELTKKWFPEAKPDSYRQLRGDYLIEFETKLKEEVANRKKGRKVKA